jgi:penicillin G amidase
LRALRTGLAGVAVLLAVTVVVAAVAAVWLPRRPLPVEAGEVAVAGLSAPVEVLRDEWGVPHIYAETPADLFRAQGYVHAQDRFWQMDMNRHVGSGRLAEMFGETQVDTDRFIRTLGWRRVSEAEWETLPEDVRGHLAAYADGVNAYLAGRTASQVSLEHAILALQNREYEIEPWEPVHTLTWLRVMAWDLRSNLESEIDRALLSRELSVDEVEDLYPPYPERHPVVVDDAPGAAGPRAPGGGAAARRRRGGRPGPPAAPAAAPRRPPPTPPHPGGGGGGAPPPPPPTPPASTATTGGAGCSTGTCTSRAP